MTEIVSLPQRAMRSKFAWLLPAVFVLGSSLGALWPGNAGQLFCIGALPGIWACFLVGAGGEPVTWLLPTLVAGVPILFFMGRLLDRLRADAMLWGIALVAVAMLAGYALLQGHEDLSAAIDHHGSFLAFLICSLQLGNYGAILLLLAVGAGRTSR